MRTERGRGAEPVELEALPVDGPEREPPRRHPVAVAAVVIGLAAVLASGVRVGVVERRDRQLRKLAGYQRSALQSIYRMNTTTSTTSTIPFGVDRSLVHLEFTPSGHIPTCAEGAASGDPAVLLEAFRVARMQGRGAEACLDARGRHAYAIHSCGGTDDVQSGVGAIPLYRCGAFVVANVSVSSGGMRNEDGSIDTYLDVTVVRLPLGDPRPTGAVQISEAVTLAPPQGGRILITDARSSLRGG